MASSVKQTERKIIFFDDGDSYVMAKLPPPKTKFRYEELVELIRLRCEKKFPEGPAFLESKMQLFALCDILAQQPSSEKGGNDGATSTTDGQ